MIKEIAKTEKSKFQAGLLENIKEPEIHSVVPDLKSLYFALRKTRCARSMSMGNDEIWANLDVADKDRLALLRLESTIFLLKPKDPTQPRTSAKERVTRSMWEPVDERLAWIQDLTRDQQTAFYRWIKKYDAKLFTGERTFEQIKRSNEIKIITLAELKDWMIAGESSL